MRRNSILIALACITFLAGIGAAVELFGGNDVQFYNGTGGASGGPWVLQGTYLNDSYLELGINANAWAAEGGKGNGSAAFTGMGSVTTFEDPSFVNDGRGFIQSVNYTGRVQATVSKTSNEGEALAVAAISANTFGSKNVLGEYVAGSVNMDSSVGVNGRNFNGKGTATAIASGSAGYSAQYINKSDETGRTTSIKTSGISRGDTYMTAANEKYLGAGNSSSGFANLGTSSTAGNNSGSSSASSEYVFANIRNGAIDGSSVLSGYANAINSESYAWDTNRTGKPDSTNYNAYTKAIGTLSAEAKTYKQGDEVYATSTEQSSAYHGTTVFLANSDMNSNVQAWKKFNNTVHRTEGTTFIDNGYTIGVTMGYLGKNLTAAESNIKTLNGGDNVGAGIFLSNMTNSTLGFTAGTYYSQNANWNNVGKKFDLTTHFLQDNFGLNYTNNTRDTGAMGVRMNILSTGRKLNALYGAGSKWTEYYTDIPQQQSWNWFGANILTLNQGETFSTEVFKPTGLESINTTTYNQRHFTRHLDTSNPF